MCYVCAPKLALLQYCIIYVLFVFDILLAFGQMNSSQQPAADSISEMKPFLGSPVWNFSIKQISIHSAERMDGQTGTGVFRIDTRK